LIIGDDDCTVATGGLPDADVDDDALALPAVEPTLGALCGWLGCPVGGSYGICWAACS
jgi:hypothetical protein